MQVEALREMGPTARLRAALELTEMSRRLLADGIRGRHPEYSDDEVRLATIRAWVGPELYRDAYPDTPELDP